MDYLLSHVPLVIVIAGSESSIVRWALSYHTTNCVVMVHSLLLIVKILISRPSVKVHVGLTIAYDTLCGTLNRSLILLLYLAEKIKELALDSKQLCLHNGGLFFYFIALASQITFLRLSASRGTTQTVGKIGTCFSE